MRSRGVRGHTTVCCICIVLAMIGATFGITVSAQDSAQPLSTFYAPVEVPLVNVDVYVTDDTGKPVSGLGINDFRVFEDGKPVEISHFYAAPGVTTRSDQLADPTTILDVEADSTLPTATEQDLFLVVFIDDTNLSRGRRQAAIKYLQGFFATDLPPGVRVMLVSYDGRLQVLHSLTDDMSQISDALNAAARRASLSRVDEENRLMRDMEAARIVAAAGGANEEDILQTYGASLFQEVQSYSDQVYQRSRTGSQNLSKLLRSMSGLPGRKALLLVSDGVEPRPGETLYAAWGQVFGSVPLFETEAQMSFFRGTQNDLTDEFTELAHLANSHRVTLYTLSTLVDGSMMAMSAERRTLDEGRLLTVQSMSVEVLASSMADTTGGRPLVNSPGLRDQLAQVAHELTSYYSLAYRPQHVGDGAYHRVKVEIPGSVYQLRYRTGYNDIPDAERINDRTLAAAIHGVGVNTMGIAVTTFETTQREDGAYLLPVIVVVPIGELILLPNADEHVGRISILLVVRDEQGGLSDIQRREYPVVVPNKLLATAIGKTAGFTMRLAVRGGKQRIAVSVLDEIARTESVATLDLDVPGSSG